MKENQITEETSQAIDRFEELERTCFVIMPFGKKDVGGKEVDFTAIYNNIFKPAICEVTTPENKQLIPERTDQKTDRTTAPACLRRYQRLQPQRLLRNRCPSQCTRVRHGIISTDRPCHPLRYHNNQSL